MKKILSAISVASAVVCFCSTIPSFAQTNESLCSFTTSSGKVVNLSSLCTGSQSSQLESITQSDLYLQSVATKLTNNYSGRKRVISGSVVNNSSNEHFLAKLEYQLYKLKSEQLVISDSGSQSLATGYGIRTGESVNFKFEVPSGFYVIVLRVKSDKFSGDPICFASSDEREDYCKRLTKQVRRF